MVSEQDINAILENLNSFTKEEYELLNTYQMKALASYDKKKYDLLKNTEPRYFQSNVLLAKYGDLAIQHKQLILNTTLEHIQVHKEILLQCLSILQSLVNNPNIVDTLINFLNSSWYGQQDFKEFISNIIQNELNNINDLYVQQVALTVKPLICFLPELFNSSSMDIDTNQISDFYNTLNEKYVLEP